MKHLGNGKEWLGFHPDDAKIVAKENGLTCYYSELSETVNEKEESAIYKFILQKEENGENEYIFENYEVFELDNNDWLQVLKVYDPEEYTDLMHIKEYDELIKFKSHLDSTIIQLFETMDKEESTEHFTAKIEVNGKSIELHLNADTYESIYNLITDEIENY